MKHFLTATILATITISTTAASPTNATLSARTTPLDLGVLSDITINVHTEAGCNGAGESYNAAYGDMQAVQVVSYHLSRDLHPEEKLQYFNALPQGGPVDMAFEGNYVACSAYIGQAMGPPYDRAGCSTLDDPVGCLRVMIEQTTTATGVSLQTGN